MRCILSEKLMDQRRGFAIRRMLVLLLVAVMAAGCNLSLNPTNLNTTAIPLLDTSSHISFNDLEYDAQLGRVIVPAGATGRLALIDPNTLGIKLYSGFSQADPASNQKAGTISAVFVRGLIFALDEGVQKIVVVDPVAGKILGAAPLQAAPDYIRYVAATNELWVTQPDKGQIEVFTLPDNNPPIPVSNGVIPVGDGPEALVIDKARGLAYTNQPTIGKTAVIQVQTRGIIAEWGNGCSKARGMALDEDHGTLFIACNEGKVVMLDTTNDGQQITSQNYGSGLDDIGYNPHLHHVYVPSGGSAILAIYGIQVLAAPPVTTAPTAGPTSTSNGSLILVRLGTADTTAKARCLATDDHDNIWVCDPNKGQVLLIKDTFPPSGQGW
jgi:hypothetical protein